MKILTIDIETMGAISMHFGLFNQNIGINQIMEHPRMICFAAKWAGGDEVMYHEARKRSGQKRLAREAHRLLDEADAVVHYNGAKFDVKHINREFKEAGLTPPSPYKQIDLLKVVKWNFLFLSNKLAYVTERLHLTGKLEHDGIALWKGCYHGDPAAWEKMGAYNRQDVVTTEELYYELIPWIPGHPNVALYDKEEGDQVCTRCGGGRLEKRGFAYTNVSKFQQYRCKDCGSWIRGSKRVMAVDLQSVAA